MCKRLKFAFKVPLPFHRCWRWLLLMSLLHRSDRESGPVCQPGKRCQNQFLLHLCANLNRAQVKIQTTQRNTTCQYVTHILGANTKITPKWPDLGTESDYILQLGSQVAFRFPFSFRPHHNQKLEHNDYHDHPDQSRVHMGALGAVLRPGFNDCMTMDCWIWTGLGRVLFVSSSSSSLSSQPSSSSVAALSHLSLAPHLRRGLS